MPHRRWSPPLTLAVALTLLANFASLPPAAAQELPLAEGTKVRVRAANPVPVPGGERIRIVGYVERLGPDSIWVHQEVRDGAIVGAGWSDVDRMDVSRGRKRNVARGAMWGAGIGLFLGALASLGEETFVSGSPEVIPPSIVGGALYGAGIGFFVVTERWHGIEVPPSARSASRDGTTLRLAVRVGI